MNTGIYLITEIGFVLITLGFFYQLIREIKSGLSKTSIDPGRQRKIINRTIVGLISWTLFIAAWSISGKMKDFSLFPLNMVPVLALPLIAALLITFSKIFGLIVVHIPPQNLIRLQSFRIFVEVLLWALFIENLAPVQMTFEGRNFDVLSGISALAVAYFVSKKPVPKPILLIWNLACLGLLINIVAIAILSMPTPFRVFMNEPANTIVAQFPISLLPGLLVPLAYTLHFFSLRKLALEK